MTRGTYVVSDSAKGVWTCVALSLALLTGCLGTGSGTTAPADDTSIGNKACDDLVTKKFSPTSINGGGQLRFVSEVVTLLGDANNVIVSADLVLKLDGKKKREDIEVKLGVNGIAASKKDGDRLFDSYEPSKDQASAKSVLRLAKFQLNGAVALLTFMAQIKKNDGELRLTVHGPHVKIAEASLDITYHRKGDCQALPPTPAPVAPKVHLDSALPAGAAVNSKNMTFTFSADQPSVVFSCSIDGAEEQVCSSPSVYSDLADGTHSFTVNAANAAGLSSDAVTHTWAIDSLAEPVVIVPPSSPMNLTSVSITFNSQEAGTHHCRIDDGAETVCSSPLQLFALSEGLHRVTVLLIDTLGNRSAPAFVEWVVDATLPAVQISSALPMGSVLASSTREISFVADESSRFVCSIDGGAAVACESPIQIENLQNGAHSVVIRATDAAGNESLPAQIDWVVDLIAPTVTLGNSIPAAGLTSASAGTLEFSASEEAQFKCAIDGAQASVCETPFSFSFAQDGAHTVAVQATDEAGNSSEAVARTWAVDTSAGDLAIAAILPSAAQHINANSVEISFHAPSDVTVSASVNGADQGLVSSPFSLDTVTEGEYMIVLAGVDTAGNATNTLSHSFAIDRTAPALTLTAAITSQVTRDTTNSLLFSSTDAAATFECELDGAGFGHCTSPVQVSALVDGAHEFRVRAIDQAGNLSAEGQASWTVDTTAPVTEVVAAQTGNQSFAVQFSSNDPSALYNCSLDGGAAQPCTSPTNFSALAPGKHTLVVRGRDEVGNVEAFGAVVELEAYQPVIVAFTAGNTVVYTNQKTMVFGFAANQAGVSFRCSVDNGLAFACASADATGPLNDGDHNFGVWAIDRFGQSSQAVSHSWTIDTQSPVILSSSNTPQSASITVTWTTNEPATSKLNWGTGTDVSRVTAETTTTQTSHSVRISGLTPNTIYSYQINGRDRAGNVYSGTRVQVRTRF